jgi:hypothetical protein
MLNQTLPQSGMTLAFKANGQNARRASAQNQNGEINV